ncbi:hypothetical protein EUA68_03030 [TM7 phylum sp. oral taxon 352]|jgi:hypothetical protein|nr:hypothetical protein EUA68_03030 [TM7 phylum sp. oral taxon 352]
MCIKVQLKRLCLRRFTLVAAVCSAIIVILTIATANAGVRVRYADLNPSELTNANGRIVLHVSVPIKRVTPEQVSLAPAVSVLVTTSGNTIVITPNERLRYQTEYHVRVRDIAGQYGRHHSNIEYHFSTPPAKLYYLQRQYSGGESKANDQIIATTMQSNKTEVLFAAPRILEFVAVRDELVVNTYHDGVSQLQRVSLSNKRTQAVPIAKPQLAAKLQSLGDGRRVGYITGEHSDTKGGQLQLLDVANGSLRVIEGVGAVTDWRASPDGRLAAVITAKSDLLLIDTVGKKQPRPLGSASELGDFSSDGRMLSFLGSAGGFVAYNLERNERRAIFSDSTQANSYIVRLKLLGKNVRLMRSMSIADRKLGSEVTYNDGRSITRLYRPDGAHDITGLSASPNSQYTAVETAPQQNSSFDNYPVNGRNMSTRTILIDQNGTVMRTIDGCDVVWK